LEPLIGEGQQLLFWSIITSDHLCNQGQFDEQTETAQENSCRFQEYPV
jgi:hypothetical protein